MTAVVVVLLVIGTGMQLLCALGILAMSNALDRLHYSGLSALGGVPIALAFVLAEGFSVRGIKAILVAALLFVTTPVLTHATGRAARVRQFGHWTAMPAEKVEDRT